MKPSSNHLHRLRFAVAKELLHTRTEQLKYGLTTTPLSVLRHNFTEPDTEFDSYLQTPFVLLGTPTWSSSETGDDLPLDAADEPLTAAAAGAAEGIEPPATVALSDVIKSLIYFIASR